MLNCRQVTRLVSKSMDTRLRWHQRLGIRLHLLYCVWCRRYAAHLRFLRQAARKLASEAESNPSHTLSDEARERIRTQLREAASKGLPPS